MPGLVCRPGVDAVGLNFVAGPRWIGYSQAEDILGSLVPPVAAVGLVECQDDVIDENQLGFLAEHGVGRVQLHGRTGPRSQTALGRLSFRLALPWGVAEADSADECRRLMAGLGDLRPWAVLLDAGGGEQGGGTGRTFRWEWVSQAREREALADWPHIILAGGLTPENVGEAVRVVRPFGVDVSSGVESAPGVKDHDKVRRFADAVREAG
jgi:phosphoribosylanthranilate isomerase